jgi:hypothetical protein
MLDPAGLDVNGLDIAFAVVVAVVVLLLVVSVLRRRRDRRLGIGGDGHWSEGPYAERKPPPLSVQRRDSSSA